MKRVIYDFETAGFDGTHAVPVQIGFAKGSESAKNVYFDVSLFPDLESSPDEFVPFSDVKTFFDNPKTKAATAVTGIDAATFDDPAVKPLKSGAEVDTFLKENFFDVDRIGYNSDNFDIKQMARLSIAADLNVAKEAGNDEEVSRLFNLYKQVTQANDEVAAGEYVRGKFGGQDTDVLTRYSQIMFGKDRPTERSGHKLTQVHKRLFPGRFTDEQYESAHDGAFDVDLTTEIHDELTEIEKRIKSGELTDNDKLLRNQFENFGQSVIKKSDGVIKPLKKVTQAISEISNTKKAGIVGGLLLGAGAVGFGLSAYNQRSYDEEQMKLAAVDDIINGDEGTYL